MVFLQEKESIRQIEEIEDAIHLAKEKSKTDAEFYKVLKEAEANRYLYLLQGFFFGVYQKPQTQGFSP